MGVFRTYVGYVGYCMFSIKYPFTRYKAHLYEKHGISYISYILFHIYFSQLKFSLIQIWEASQFCKNWWILVGKKSGVDLICA